MHPTVDLLSSFTASFARLGAGLATPRSADQPDRLVELYEFEGCPYCRIVREALTELDLDARIYPCPKGGTRFRPRVAEMGGRQQFPYLVDPNAGERMYESADIIAYLYSRYGGGRRPPLHLRLRPYAVPGAAVATLLRSGRGGRARPSCPAAEPLELWSFEASPFARLVREALCELELSYTLRTLGRRDPREHVPPPLRGRLGLSAPPSTEKRRALAARAGKVQVPYLADPNTGTELFESRAIVGYLESTYGS